MSSKSSHRSPNLFVVKGTETPHRMTSIEELTKEQRELVDSYKKLSSSEGVIVGVLHGRASWDLRPLLLAQGRISVIRFSDPSLVTLPELNARFSALLRALQIERNITAAITVGHANNQHWVRRVWFDETMETLVDAGRDFGDPMILLRSLIVELERLHAAGLPHGHLCPANIALVQDFPCIFDFGFLVSTPAYSAPNCAPEIQGGAFASPASDIYSLGLVMRSLLGTRVSPHIGDILDRMTAPDPLQRPGLEEVKTIAQPPEAMRRVSAAKPLTGVGHSSAVPATSVIAPPGAIITEQAARVEPSISAPAPPPVAAAGPGITWFQAIMLGLLAALCILGISRLRETSFFKSSAELQLEYQQYWNSGQAGLRRMVADAALLDDDRFAQAVIVSALQEGGNKLIGDLLRIAFDPRWEEDLSDADRRAILGIVLEKAINYKLDSFPPLEVLHPGVILAVISSLSVESQGKQFEKVPVARMAELPGELGGAFGVLAAEGIEHMEQLPAKGLSHLIAGDVSNATISAFLYRCGEVPVCLVRLSALLSLPSLKSGAETTIYTRLPIAVPQISPLVDWFEEGEWSNVKTGDKLQLLVGRILPGRSFEQMADLLRFPLPAVRKEAIKALSDEVFGMKGMQAFVEAIANMPRETAITRQQNVLLLVAMRARGETAFDLIKQWFTTKPNPQAVLQLLIARPEAGAMDPFSYEASLYLNHETWTVTTDELRKLTKHDDLGARTLAYSKLRVDVPEELEILRERGEEEPNQKTRDLIKQRLQTAALIRKSQ